MTTQTEARGEVRSRSNGVKAERIGAGFALGTLSIAFLAFATQYVPRLTNNVWSDVEFSGWVAALGHRLRLGERMYEELILPIPPGSIWLLAKIEGFVGRPLMLTEAWACAICQLLMALLAYAMAAPFAKRRTALLVSGTTLAFVIQLPKELVYDHTAQVVAWGAVACLAHGLVAYKTRWRPYWLFGAGTLAGIVCVFKQSTAMGAIGGGIVAIGYLSLVAHRRGEPKSLKTGLASLVVYGIGAALGLALTLGFIAAIDGSIAGFIQTVFKDGSALKGGWKVLVPRMLGYTTMAPTLPLPLLLVMGGAAIVFRMVRSGGSLVVPSPADDTEASRKDERAPIPSRELLGILTIVTVAFGGAATLLASGVEPGKALLPGRILYAITSASPALGVALGTVFLVANFRPSRMALSRADALSALLLAVIVGAIAHNGSVQEPRFFYDNNAIVAFGLLCLFLAIERTRLPWLRWAVFAALMLSIFGGKMERYLAARTKVEDNGFWAGMYINQRGEPILEASERVRELTAPDEEVLVLPEDVSLAALIGRPRPKLCGAIAFVDQYPARCLSHDIEALETNPPKVIVVYPSQEYEWQRMYRLWSNQSPSGFLNRAVMRYHLPARYRLDSSYKAIFWQVPTRLEIYVRNDGPLAPVK